MISKKYFLIFLSLLCVSSFIHADTNHGKLLQAEKIFLPNGEQYYFQAYQKENSPPELIITGPKNQKQKIQFGKSYHGAIDAMSFSSSLHFIKRVIPGFPKPLMVAVAVAPAGDTTLFFTRLIGFKNGQIKLLNEPDWETFAGDGVFIGKISKHENYGTIIWGPIVDNRFSKDHFYLVDIYSWDGIQFKKISELKTKYKYNNYVAALKELNLNADATDIIYQDFPLFNKYR